jgi:hypothetical protein
MQPGCSIVSGKLWHQVVHSRVMRCSPTCDYKCTCYRHEVALRLITVEIHLVQMSLLLTKERPAWPPQIPRKQSKLIGNYGIDVGVAYLYRLGAYADLSPRNGFVRSCTRVGAVKLLTRILHQEPFSQPETLRRRERPTMYTA